MRSTVLASGFVLLWLLCPIVAIATFRFLVGGVAITMPGFLYQAEMRPLAFYAHIVLGSVALGLVPFQFWQGLRFRQIRVHRWLGRAYGVSVLAGGTGGLWLAVTSRSGDVASWGFGLLAIAWVGATVCGILLAMGRNASAHRDWMIRSAALTIAAVTLRIYLGLGMLLGFSYEDIAGFLAWSCWVPNLIAAELILRHGRGRRRSPVAASHQAGRL
ncbi:hypothetical protein CXZ10_00955 [Pleomorphomonas diazotrophica]|uniref:DUF2306 domain-containing protein n=2 Tax=Pleomorphomonas diazotrophica TaxID=1166257 RepID=A0A2N3M2D8_9HYPH|nr:hypothetical protein CXZ10_00955 [Pleomorphomonas diazotrophica]